VLVVRRMFVCCVFLVQLFITINSLQPHHIVETNKSMTIVHRVEVFGRRGKHISQQSHSFATMAEAKAYADCVEEKQHVGSTEIYIQDDDGE
jgi:hypothetical protein